MSSAAYALPDRALVLDRYRPLRPLGRGGSGSVWLARDERTGLDVALKIVPREGKRAARAMREMEAASRLRHERCVRAYDFAGDDGHVYIAYEYVRGKTLREAIRRDELSEAAAVEAAAQVLDGLAHAHRRGIVHRDVKPSNVLLEESDDVAVRVLDFGLAQFDDADTLTAVGDVPGTLAYISPERLGGADATVASDVWAVGVMLWEALAGTHPFWGVPLPEVASTIAAGAPPLSARRSDLPRRLLAAVDSALDVDPSRRPTASQLAAELREAFVAVPRPRERRKERPASRRATRPAPRRVPRRLRSRSRTGCRPRSWRRARRPSAARSLPFWPPPVLVLLSLAAGLATLRAPRLGLAIALAAPVFPLGNVAQAAAIVYGVLALAWLAVTWRDARAGLLFALGPLLAPLGLLPLLPLAVQPARGAWRRGLQAGVGVLAAAAVAGLAGRPLPLTGAPVGDLGLAESERPTDVVQALERVLTANAAVATTALALALVAVLLPRAVARGRVGDRRARRAPARPRPALGAVHSRVRDRRRHVAPLRRAGRPAASRRGRCAASAARLDRGRLPRRMSVLRAIESRIEGLFEGVFGRAFRTHVQPVELARKLAKEMDEHRSVSVSRVYVPNEYTLYLSPRGPEPVRRIRGIARRRAPGVPRRARPPGGLRAARPAARPARDRRRPRDRRVRDRDAPDAARGDAPPAPPARLPDPVVLPAPESPAVAPVAEAVAATMVYPAPPERDEPQEVATLTVDGRVVPLSSDRVVIGRSRECDVRVEDGNVSRRHAELSRDGGSDWTVVDLGSTNGTEVNGRRITKRTSLDDGDRIGIGAAELVFGRSLT